MSDTEAQWAEARRWIAKAEEDRRCAALLAGADPPMLAPAAYHCQQAAEKLLKALLVVAAAAVPKTHDLERLAALAMPAFPTLAEAIEALAGFTPWGTATRYPELEADMGIMPEDIREALAAIDAFRAAIAALDSAHP